MERTPFQFKQFSVDDKGCAMKVGTDGVLLGAWTSVPHDGTFLDIGTGCGLIALMLAQRSSAHITAIEIEHEAVQQSLQNFKDSPWTERLTAVAGAVQQYNSLSKFNLIISNPPFFTNSLKAPEKQRNAARHNDTLPPEALLFAIDNLLSDDGIFAFILPVSEAQNLIATASSHHLYLNRSCLVFSKEGKQPNRLMGELSRSDSSMEKESLYIRTADGKYSQEYRTLTEPFYLMLKDV
ncbi:MAG: methyltransferase [Bacteroidetes bacterium]|nr:methyltransferase [Bacteroidota bacterium]